MYVFIYLNKTYGHARMKKISHACECNKVYIKTLYIYNIYIYIYYIHAHNYTYTIAHTGILRYSAHLCVYARLCTCRFVSARTNPHDKGWINLDLRFFRATPKGAGLQLKGNGVLVCNRHH